MKQGVGKAFGSLRKLNIKPKFSSPNALRKQAEKMGRVFGSKASVDSPHKAIGEVLQGTWEIDLSNVHQVSNAIGADSSVDTSNISPMVNISQNLDIILLPLTNEIVSIQSINEYLSSISLNSGSSISPKIFIPDENDDNSESFIPIQLIIEAPSATTPKTVSNGTHNNNNNNNDGTTDDESKDNDSKTYRIILEGKILTEEFSLSWNDGSKWNQIRSSNDVLSENDDYSGLGSIDQHETHHHNTTTKQSSKKSRKKDKKKDNNNNNNSNNNKTNGGYGGDDNFESSSSTTTENLQTMSKKQLISKVRECMNEISTLKEKQQMAKMQTQATLAQFADLSTNYAELEKGKKEAESKYFDIHNQLEAARLENQTIKESFQSVNDQLRDVQSAVVYEQVQEIQLKLTKMREENELLKQTNSSQQEDIISLREQLQAVQIASKQYVSTIEDIKKKLSDSEEKCQELLETKGELKESVETFESEIEELKHSKELTINRYEDKIRSYEEGHKKEIQQLERGFQETLLRNNRKIEDLEVVRNNIVKKNASLTKDIKRLMTQIQSENFSKNPSDAEQIPNVFNNINTNEKTEKLQQDNDQLRSELTKKSEALVEALRALAYVHADSGKEHDDAEALRHSIEAKNTLQKLSHLAEYQGNITNFDEFNNDILEIREASRSNSFDNNGSSHREPSGTPISSRGAISNDMDGSHSGDSNGRGSNNMSRRSDDNNNSNDMNSYNNNNNNYNNGNNNNSFDSNGNRMSLSSDNIGNIGHIGHIVNDGNKGNLGKGKFANLKNRLKSKELGTKMKAGLSKGLTSMKEKMKEQSMKSHMQSPAIGVVHPKRASKTKQQLSTHVKTLQSLANELSATIEQKEEILESLRFANAYLGKRVIALETVSNMQPGAEIPDQDNLISRALDIRADVFKNETKSDNENDDDNNNDNNENNNNVNIVNDDNNDDNDNDNDKEKIVENDKQNERNNEQNNEIVDAETTENVNDNDNNNSNDKMDSTQNDEDVKDI